MKTNKINLLFIVFTSIVIGIVLFVLITNNDNNISLNTNLTAISSVEKPDQYKESVNSELNKEIGIISSTTDAIKANDKAKNSDSGKPFLPIEIMNGKVAIASSIDDVLSSMNYLREPDMLLSSMTIPYLFSLEDISDQCYFNSIKISFNIVEGSRGANQILLVKRIKDYTYKEIEKQTAEFMQLCYKLLGEPEKNFITSYKFYGSEFELKLSNMVWFHGGCSYWTYYYSKKMREDALKYMNESEAMRYFKANRLIIETMEEGENKLAKVKEMEESVSNFFVDQQSYFDY